MTAGHISVPVPLAFLKLRMGQRSRKSFVLFIFEEDVNVKLRELLISQCSSPTPASSTDLVLLTSFTELPCSMHTAFTLETFPGDVTGLVASSSVKARIVFAAAVLTINDGYIRLKKKTTNP